LAPKKHDNQHTTPPFTEKEWVERFQALVPQPNGGPDGHDWPTLFIGFIHSTATEYPSLKQYAKSKKVSYSALQTRGGAMFWNRARQSIQAAAIAKAVKEAPETMAVKYAKQLRIISKLEDAIEHRVDLLRNEQEASKKDPVANPPNPFETALMEKLIDGISELAKTNILLDNDGVEKHEHKVLNLHAMMVKAVEDRDKQHRVEGD
jgi:hypothetical protein